MRNIAKAFQGLRIFVIFVMDDGLCSARLEEFLMDVGRRKYLEPLYKELKKTPEGLAVAKAIYAKARPRYHAVSRGTIDELLGRQPGS